MLQVLMKRLFGYIPVILTAVMVCLLLMSSGCSASNHEGFAVYLTKEDVHPAQIPALSQVEIVGPPVIALNDIITYDAATHEITLTAEAFDRISCLEVPVRGRSFAVCVDRKPVYTGAFWTPVSSISFDSVTIMKPLNSQESQVIKLEQGYPSSSFYGGEDPRNNAEIMQSLEQAGKLINKPSATSADIQILNRPPLKTAI